MRPFATFWNQRAAMARFFYTERGSAMTDVSRRGLLTGTVALGGAAGLGLVGSTAGVASAEELTSRVRTAGKGGAGGSGAIGPDDPRYADLVLRGQNRLFTSSPDQIRVPRSTEDVVRAVEDAVKSGKRIAARGGGHCFEDFVDNPQVKMLVDMSQLNDVSWDERHRAFSIGAGATLDEVYDALYYGWGVTVPGGGCLSVGVGGHFCGGGYGPLSRVHGSVVDHLYGLEIVVVDKSGRARPIIATREKSDPHRDLWWAHTGAGGGNYGVITRYLMRSQGASGNDPTKALPRPPATLLSNLILWSWPAVTKESFTRALTNFFSWYAKNSAPGSPYASLYSPFLIPPSAADGFLLSTQIDGTLPNAKKLLTAFNQEMVEGLSPAPFVSESVEGPFLNITRARSIAESMSPTRGKWKAAYLRKPYTTSQIETIHTHLTDPDYRNPASTLLFVPYGGQVNTVDPGATATAQRSSFMKMVLSTSWTDPTQDEKEIGWAQNFYKDLYAETGGVPVPNDANEGSYINYPDADLADPEWNTSGVPWHTLYYKGNYPRLQRVKARFDPRDVFRHALSIELPD